MADITQIDFEVTTIATSTASTTSSSSITTSAPSTTTTEDPGEQSSSSSAPTSTADPDACWQYTGTDPNWLGIQVLGDDDAGPEDSDDSDSAIARRGTAHLLYRRTEKIVNQIGNCPKMDWNIDGIPNYPTTRQAQKMLKEENQYWWAPSQPKISGSPESTQNCPVAVIQQQATKPGDASVDHVCR